MTIDETAEKVVQGISRALLDKYTVDKSVIAGRHISRQKCRYNPRAYSTRVKGKRMSSEE